MVPLISFLAVEGDGGLILLVVEYFIDGNPVGMGEDVLVLGLGVEFSGVLLEGDGFDGFGLLHIDSIALIIEFLVLSEGLSQAGLVVKTNFLGVLVGFSPNSSPRLFPATPHLHFQIPYHPTITIIFLNPTINYHYYYILGISMEPAKLQPPKINYLKCLKTGLHEEENMNLVCLEKGCL